MRVSPAQHHRAHLEEVVDLGATHLVTRGRVGNDVDDAHAGAGGGDAVGDEVDVEAERGEDILELGDHLEREHVLAAVVADLEDGGLPGLVRLRLGAVVLDDRLVVVLAVLLLLLANLERGHERRLGVRLERATGLAVDVDDDAVGVGREVDALVDLDRLDLLVDLGLRRVSLNETIIPRTFFSALDFLMYGWSFLEMEVTVSKKVNSRS